jgi:hypothetical protein
MNNIPLSHIYHDIECAEAAFAVLIEKASNHTERRFFISERNSYRREMQQLIIKNDDPVKFLEEGNEQ